MKGKSKEILLKSYSFKENLATGTPHRLSEGLYLPQTLSTVLLWSYLNLLVYLRQAYSVQVVTCVASM